MIEIPEIILDLILLYCDCETMSACCLVSKKFSSQSAKVIRNIIKVIIGAYYSRAIFESPYFIRPADLSLLKSLTTEKIVVVRGFITYLLNLSNGKWKRLADTRRDRGYFALVCLRGELFAIGTYSLTAAGTCEKFNTFANCWTSVKDLPLKLRSACAAVLDDKLYVLGGHDCFSETYSDSIFVYDNETTIADATLSPKCKKDGNWLLLDTRLLRPRSRHAAAAFEGKIWIAGGCFENNTIVTKSVEIFDPKEEKWTKGPSLTTRRDFSNLSVVCGNLYAVGGDVDVHGAPAIRTIEVYVKVTNSWEIITAFKDERRGFSTSAIGSKIYIFGGSSDLDYELNTWDAYDVVKLEWDSDLNKKYEKMPVIDCWGQAVTIPPVKPHW